MEKSVKFIIVPLHYYWNDTKLFNSLLYCITFQLYLLPQRTPLLCIESADTVLTMGFLYSFGFMQRTKNGWQTLKVFISSSKDLLNWLLRVGERFLVSAPYTDKHPHNMWKHRVRGQVSGSDFNNENAFLSSWMLILAFFLFLSLNQHLEVFFWFTVQV